MADSDQQIDEALMNGVAARDTESLRGLFDRHAPIMLGLGRRILRDNDDAEDVLSEVFWEVWSKPDRYDSSRGSARAYLLLIMRSRCLDRLRARKSRPDMNAAMVNAQAHAGSSETPLAVAEHAESRAIVRAAVGDLDDDQRAAIELSFFEGLSHSEIAERLEAPLGTIKGRLRSGLIKLGRSLRKKGDATL